MLKVIGSLMVIISTTLSGILYGGNFKKRTHQLKELQRCIYQLQNEIVYTYTPLPQAFSNISKKSVYPINNFFDSISKLLYLNKVNNVYDGFQKAYEEVKDILNFTKEDINILFNFGKSLGESDIEGQKKVFALSLDNIKNQIEEAEILMKKNVKMYRFLGFSIGMMIVIIFI
ncbi:MAG: stage III sporulation protein SpoIIIAB [Clostridiaceae bacterium]